MTAKRLGKKLLKIACLIIGLLVLLLIGFHFWFKAHAKEMLEEMVSAKSDGKIKLKIEKIRFNYFSRKIDLKKAVFYNTDTLTGTTAYRFSVDNMILRVKAIFPMVFRKEILIDSLTMKSPLIEVTRLRAGIKTGNKSKKDVSIPEEMGKVYSSIQDALKILRVKRFQIDDGTFTLVNNIDSAQLPMTVSNIQFIIDNLEVSAGPLSGQEKIFFSDNIMFRSTNQNIIFPDGRHRLSFSRFRINLKNKLVAFDSCTIAATKSENSSASFKVFFDALLLTNIDFDTLYKSEVIKADSVYCVNPTFDLDVETGKKKGSKKPAPKLEDIVKQLTGDLQLDYVVVSNAAFNIKTVKNDVPNSFTFSNNNFEMQGLSVDQEAAKPVTVRSFAMAIRNYENFIKDSTYSLKFDSVLFRDDHITLSNFLFNKLDQGKILNTFSIPEFSLRGLSWDDLVFERKLKAEQAVMLKPYISYTASKKKKGNQTIFQSLGAINEFMDLQQLDIVNGNIDLKLRNNLRVKLENATLSVKSQSLLESKKLAGIKNSLTQIKFNKGIIHAGDVDMELYQIAYTGQTGQFGAGTILLKNKEKNLVVTVQDVTGRKMQVDEVSGNVYAEGVRWSKGDIKLNLAGVEKKEGQSTIILKDLLGTNTVVSGFFGGRSVSTKLNSIFLNQLEKRPGNPLLLDGLDIHGQQLKVSGKNLALSVAGYNITDNRKSSLQDIRYQSTGSKMNAGLFIPSLTIVPHIQPLLNGDIMLDTIRMDKPVIDLQLEKDSPAEETSYTGLPKISINDLLLNQPRISFTQVTNNGLLKADWHGEQNSSDFLHATDLRTNAGITTLQKLDFYLSGLALTSPKGKSFHTGDGKVAAQIRNIRIIQEEEQPMEWSGMIANLDTRDFRLDSIGKANGTLVMKSGSLNDLHISSATIPNLQLLTAANPAFLLQHLTGQYGDARNQFTWFNAGFNRRNNTLSLDSFSLIPALSRDSFMAKQVYQTDYLELRSGAVRIGPVNIDRYIRDKILYSGKLYIDRFHLTDYKDKRLPFLDSVIKPLPVILLKNIPQQLHIDSVLLTNATVVYTEFNDKTNAAGTIPVTGMTVNLQDVKNFDLEPRDSLRIQATGYVMDTAWISLQVEESYTDSLAGFRMAMRMKPADLKIINPAIIPLASVKVKSGMLDTLDLLATGNEYVASGEMKMFYHDLKVRFLVNGEESRKTLKTRLMNFIANTFVIRNKNLSRPGQAFFIRDRGRSAINYLIKTAMSGISSSTGAKNNKKIMRRYLKQQGKSTLSPVQSD